MLPLPQRPLRRQGREDEAEKVRRIPQCVLDQSALLLPIVGDVHGVICGDDRFTRKVLVAAKKLRVISKWGTGIDSIDTGSATFHGDAAVNLSAHNPFDLPPGPMGKDIPFVATPQWCRAHPNTFVGILALDAVDNAAPSARLDESKCRLESNLRAAYSHLSRAELRALTG